MIASHGLDGRQVNRGVQQHLRSTSGASAARIIEPADTIVAEHHHDWPVLTLYVMGDAIRIHDTGEVRLNRPSVALHAAAEPHANVIRSSGVEQIDIEFDPAWLKSMGGLAVAGRGRVWIGGKVAAGARTLGRLWADPASTEDQLARSTAELLEAAIHDAGANEPPWLQSALREVDEGRVTSTADLARRLRLHPGWLAQAYRAAVGEGLGQSVQRHRIQRATMMLRTTDLEAAAIAADAGFCDQSHMIRSFKRLLGRSPTCIRNERDQLRPLERPIIRRCC